MKSKQNWIYIFVLILVTLALVLWHRPAKQVTMPRQAQEFSQSTGNNSLVASSVKQNVSGHPQPVSISPPAQKQETDEKKGERIIREANAAYHQPIEFYGQMIDQYTNPIPDVKIRAFILHEQISTPTPSGDFPITNSLVHLERETGVDGRFEVIGEEGRNLTFESIQKDGYELSGGMPQTFGAINGTFDNPVIFKMWKDGPKASLIGGSHVFGIDSGKTYTLDLIIGKKIEGQAEGDLLVSVTRPPNADPRAKFPWSFSIEAIQGGLVEAVPDDEFMYAAPDSGYQPKIEMQFDPSDSNWIGVMKERFFIRSRNGQVYGRAQVEIDSIYNVHSAIQIDYAINPNGSRNLQP